MIIGGSAYYELLHNNYRPRGSEWVKISKEKPKAFNRNPKSVTNRNFDSSDYNYPDDIDEFEYDEDSHAIIPF